MRLDLCLIMTDNKTTFQTTQAARIVLFSESLWFIRPPLSKVIGKEVYSSQVYQIKKTFELKGWIRVHDSKIGIADHRKPYFWFKIWWQASIRVWNSTTINIRIINNSHCVWHIKHQSTYKNPSNHISDFEISQAKNKFESHKISYII